jgi:hypothetical protein
LPKVRAAFRLKRIGISGRTIETSESISGGS